MHSITNTKPILSNSPFVWINRWSIKAIIPQNIALLKTKFLKNGGIGVFVLTDLSIRSKKDPRGQNHPHQYRPLNTDNVKKTIIIANTT